MRDCLQTQWTWSQSTPVAIFDDDNHHLLQDMYSKCEHHGYVCVPLNMTPTDYGGMQHRLAVSS